MEYLIAKPSLYLSKFIKHYWTIDNCLPLGQKHIQRIVPNGLTELMFYFDDRPKTTGQNISVNYDTLVTGQLNEFYDLQVTGKLSLFSIIFKPYGLSVFFDIPIGEFFNQNIPLRFVLQDTVNELETKLFESKSFHDRILIIEKFLVQRLHICRKKYHLNRIIKSIELINQSKGIVDIKILAKEACFSRKQFERTFLDLVGITPKKFLNIVRFQNAINQKALSRNMNLTSLSHKCGYYDQSHMINDFYKLSGMTPKQYFKECEPYSDYFQ